MPTDFIFETAKIALPLLFGTTVYAAGLAPKAGPGRALIVALRSRFTFSLNPPPDSARTAQVQKLKHSINQKSWGQSYYVITGQKGVGKTRLIDTATKNTCGIIKVKITAGEPESMIIDKVLKSLTRTKFSFFDPQSSAKRVIFFYKLMTLGRTPVIVLNCSERTLNKGYAELTGAVRTLTDDFKLRVIVTINPKDRWTVLQILLMSHFLELRERVKWKSKKCQRK